MRKTTTYLSLAVMLSFVFGSIQLAHAGKQETIMSGEKDSGNVAIELESDSEEIESEDAISSAEIVQHSLMVEGDVEADGAIVADSGDFMDELQASEIVINNKATLSGEIKISGVLTQPYSEVNTEANVPVYLSLTSSRMILGCSQYGMYDVVCDFFLPMLPAADAAGQQLSVTCKNADAYAVLNTDCKIRSPLSGAILAPGGGSPTAKTITLDQGESANFYAIPTISGGGVGATWVLQSRTDDQIKNILQII